MNKELRNKIKNKFNGRCSYCGIKLKDKYHVDHVMAKNRGGENIEENYYPACISCNIRKSDYSIEEFREQLKYDIIQLRRDSSKFRMLERYNILNIDDTEIKFYFEIL